MTLFQKLLGRLIWIIRSTVGTNGLGRGLGHLAEAQTELVHQLRALHERLDHTQASTVSNDPLTGPAWAVLRRPDGLDYELSVDAVEPDVFHRAIAAGGAKGDIWSFLMAWLRPGDVLFDLGANIGTISIPAARGGASVHAFEVLGANVQHLMRSAGRNQLTAIHVVQGAVSDRHGTVGISGTSAWGTVVQDAQLSVATVVIDEYVKERNVGRVDVMKIDVEGSELAALHGASKLISSDGPDIVIEANVVTCGNAGYSYRTLLRLLADREYRVFQLQNGRLCPWDAETTQAQIVVDYFATRKGDDEIRTRCDWEISALRNQEIETAILGEVELLHRQYVVAVEDLLPTPVRTNPSVAAAIAAWRDQGTPSGRSVMKVGSA